MDPTGVWLEFNRYVQLVVDSGLYHSLRNGQIPELNLVSIMLILSISSNVFALIMLGQESRENKELHRVVDEMHAEDAKRAEIDPVSHADLAERDKA